MQAFTDTRTSSTPDQLWLLQHNPIYTQGLAGRSEHVLNPQNIPVVQTDRGGQVTYHGPGQLMLYALFDINRMGLSTRDFVRRLETVIVQVLADYGIVAAGREDAPGVYVGEKKIASIGLRVRKGCSYHGCSLNVAGDLEPFQGINPCGFNRLQMTCIGDYRTVSYDEVVSAVCKYFAEQFGFKPTEMQYKSEWEDYE